MRAITMADAKVMVKNRDLFTEVGVKPYRAVLYALTRLPMDKSAVDLLLTQIDDVEGNVPVMIERHGEHKSYSLISAIIASGVYSNEELCGKYNKKILTKAARSVAMNPNQYRGGQCHGFSLLMHMKLDLEKTFKQDPVGYIVRLFDKYHGRPFGRDGWYVNADDKATEEAMAASVATVILVLNYIGSSLGELLGGAVDPYSRIPLAGRLDVSIIEKITAAMATAMPSEYDGHPIVYGVEVALWLRRHYNTAYYGVVNYGAGGPRDTHVVKIPDDVDPAEFRAMVADQATKFGTGSFTDAWGNLAPDAVIVRFMLESEHGEDVV